VSYLTFVNMLDHLNALKVMPTRIDNSLWSGKFSGTNGVLLNAGLKFLRLVDGDRPNEAFEALVFAKPDERKTFLKEVLGKAYGPELMNLASKTPKMVDEAIRALGTTDSTHRKAISFFIQAAKAADVPMPSTIAKRARNRPGTSARRRTGSPSPSEKPRAASDVHKPGNVGDDVGAIKIVELHGATVKLWSSSANLIELAAYPEELEWFSGVLAKFTEGESLANKEGGTVETK
jgi:hypothetical protein